MVKTCFFSKVSGILLTAFLLMEGLSGSVKANCLCFCNIPNSQSIYYGCGCSNCSGDECPDFDSCNSNCAGAWSGASAASCVPDNSKTLVK